MLVFERKIIFPIGSKYWTKTMKLGSIQVSESSWRRLSKSSNLLPQSPFMHKGFTLLKSKESSAEPPLLPPTEDDSLFFFFLFPLPLILFFFWAAALCKAHNTSDPLSCLPSPISFRSRLDLKKVVSPALDEASSWGCAERCRRWFEWTATVWGKLEMGMTENDLHEIEDAVHMLLLPLFLSSSVSPPFHSWAKRWAANLSRHLFKRRQFLRFLFELKWHRFLFSHLRV